MRSNNEVGPGASSLWISWNAHRRTDGLCAAWGIPQQVIRPTLPGALKWVELPQKTLRVWGRARPRFLFVQNLSLALTSLAVLFRPLFRYRLVVDAHNDGVRPFDRPYAAVRWLTRRLLKADDVTIMTNDALAEDVRAAGGRPLSLPDLRFAFTGRAERYRPAAAPTPPNVRLTGFLDDADYWQLLTQATVVCDLTLKPDCLVCGAYEALAVGKPMVLSDNPPTHDLFGPAAVLTDSRPDAIVAALRRAIDERERLEAGARQLQAAFPARWQAEADAVWEDIEAQAGSAKRASA